MENISGVSTHTAFIQRSVEPEEVVGAPKTNQPNPSGNGAQKAKDAGSSTFASIPQCLDETGDAFLDALPPSQFSFPSTDFFFYSSCGC